MKTPRMDQPEDQQMTTKQWCNATNVLSGNILSVLASQNAWKNTIANVALLSNIYTDKWAFERDNVEYLENTSHKKSKTKYASHNTEDDKSTKRRSNQRPKKLEEASANSSRFNLSQRRPSNTSKGLHPKSSHSKTSDPTSPAAHKPKRKPSLSSLSDEDKVTSNVGKSNRKSHVKKKSRHTASSEGDSLSEIEDSMEIDDIELEESQNEDKEHEKTEEMNNEDMEELKERDMNKENDGERDQDNEKAYEKINDRPQNNKNGEKSAYKMSNDAGKNGETSTEKPPYVYEKNLDRPLIEAHHHEEEYHERKDNKKNKKRSAHKSSSDTLSVSQMLDRAKKMALWITLVELDQARRNGTLSPSEDEDDNSRPKNTSSISSSLTSVLATPSPSEHATSPESISSSEPGGDVVTPSNESPGAIVGMLNSEGKDAGILDLCEELLRDINRFQQNYGKKVEV
ncbi:3051_t:CDS:2 [Paraglomus occultum]|uniref:3051_t:CDS:1 n=1 Tax=Paraglomus occultum TaxID=144539 RepID=A0A9N9AIZ3_9GLOM|nr:3051_t:CDS:2 [Paraglomus occultum]